jgi:hypothetical protein
MREASPFPRIRPAPAAFLSRSHTRTLPAPPQVIGNKWDTYLELLQADYSET